MSTEVGMWRRTSGWLEQWTGAEWKPTFRTPEGEARDAALDAAVKDIRRDFIVEALSWAETINDGRLGHERAEMLLASHDAALTDKAKAEALREAAAEAAFWSNAGADEGVTAAEAAKWLNSRADRMAP